ncbi:MAG: carboxymuconolactone decarboxylase family protein, partial [Halieaceae bacterium]|nr:carboxymuconolactone decarboxylase family protein [Halieaceae bacterium]
EQIEVLTRAKSSKIENAANIFRTLANYPKLLKRWLVFANHVLFKSTLNDRDREILILRIGWLCQAEYEWAQHVVIGMNAGITAQEIERIKQGPDAPGWSAFDATLLRATDELHNDAFITQLTWNELSTRYSQEQLMDVIFTVGNYTIVSMALNTLGVQLDEGLKGF